jgi:hypothetical protein
MPVPTIFIITYSNYAKKMKSPLASGSKAFDGPNVIVFLALVLVFVALWLDIIRLPAIISAVLTLFGTATGAVLAFRFQEMREQTAQQSANKVSMSKAFFILARQYSAVLDLEMRLLPTNNPLERAFSTAAMLPPKLDDLVQDFNELAFLLDGYGEEVLALTNVQESFYQMLVSVKMRSEHFVEVVSPLLTPIVGVCGEMSEDKLRETLGTRVFEACVSNTAQMYEIISQMGDRILQISADLRTPARAIFPGTKFIGFLRKNAVTAGENTQNAVPVPVQDELKDVRPS